MNIDSKLKKQIEEFKRDSIDKPPLEIIQHYQKELLAIQDCLDIISGRWKMPIISLLCNGEFRFSELEKGLKTITPKMLSKELKDLEQNKLIIRNESTGVSVKVSYTLADYGYTLVPLILELVNWGTQHREIIRFSATTKP